MRAYLDGVAEGLATAPRMAALFAGHGERLEQELAVLRVRQAYAAAKAALWQARADGDQVAEQEAAAEVHGLPVSRYPDAGATCIGRRTGRRWVFSS